MKIFYQPKSELPAVREGDAAQIEFLRREFEALQAHLTSALADSRRRCEGHEEAIERLRQELAALTQSLQMLRETPPPPISVPISVVEPTPEPLPEPTPEPVPEPVPEPMVEPVAELPEPAPVERPGALRRFWDYLKEPAVDLSSHKKS